MYPHSALLRRARLTAIDAAAPLAIVAALLSAFIHASWNAAMRGGDDKELESAILGSSMIPVGIVYLAIAGPPAAAALPMVALSGVIHAVYTWALGRSYAVGELAHVYTIARGTPPLLIALGAFLIVGEQPSLLALAGIALVSAGVFGVGFDAHAPLRASLWAAFVAVMIAGYSLTDAFGARAAGNSFAYLGAMNIASGLCFMAIAPFMRPVGEIVVYVSRRWRRAAAIGIVASVGYGLVLWAQTQAPIATISALRETSVVVAAVIGVIVLREQITRRRVIGAAAVSAGAILIALG